MERKLRSLTEQMNVSRSNYDRILGRTTRVIKEQESTVTMFGCLVEYSGPNAQIQTGSAYAVTVDTSFCSLQNIMVSEIDGYNYPMYESNSQIWAVEGLPNPWNVSNACEDGMSISETNIPWFGAGSNWGANTSMGMGGPNFWFSNPTQATDHCSNLAEIYSSGGVSGTTSGSTSGSTSGTTSGTTGTTETTDVDGDGIPNWGDSDCETFEILPQDFQDTICNLCETPDYVNMHCSCCQEWEAPAPEPGTGGMSGPGKPVFDKKPYGGKKGKDKKRRIKESYTLLKEQFGGGKDQSQTANGQISTNHANQLNMATAVLVQQGPVCCDHGSDYYGHNAQGVLLQGPNGINVTDTYLMTGMGDSQFCDDSLCSGPNPDDFSGGPDGALPEVPDHGKGNTNPVKLKNKSKGKKNKQMKKPMPISEEIQRIKRLF